MIQDNPGEERTEERALQARPGPPSAPAPLAAMAEALRANAEALHRIDSSQHRLAETIQRSDRAGEVVASTRALNETFRGLSEIQRGLLDALLRGRGRGGGGSPLLYFGLALLVALLSVLVYDRWMGSRTVPLTRFEEARAQADALRGDVVRLEADAQAAAGREKAWSERLAGKEQAMGELERSAAASKERIGELERELETKSTRLEQFLAVKRQADLAATLQVRNAMLEREVRQLSEKVKGLEQERGASLEYFGEKLLDLRGVDPEAIKEIARKMEIYKDPEPPPMAGGPVRITRTAKRLLLHQINALLPDAEEAYEVLDVGAVADGYRLQDVTLARHRNNRLVGSLRSKELTIFVDVEKDTVEIRLQGGFLTNTSRPGEQVPIPEEGHSIFLTGVGVKDWLRRFQGRISVGEKGRLTWNSTPS